MFSWSRFCIFTVCAGMVIGCGGGSSTEESAAVVGGTGPGGGIIFTFLDDTNTTGLELFPTPIGQKAWGCAGVNIDPGNVLRPTNGVGAPSGANSSALLFDANATGQCFSEAAELVIAFSNNGKNDWYIPSTDELIIIRELGFLPGDTGEAHWSSTEDSAQNAFTVLVQAEDNPFDNGEPSTTDKTTVANIIAIRTF